MTTPPTDVAAPPAPTGSSADDTPNDSALTLDRLSALREQFDDNPANHVAQNAVTKTGLDEVALNRRVVTSIDHTFSDLLDDWKVTDQQRSGRCWMFAAMNLFRVGAMKKMNLKEFEFSQNYTLFWDKFERANFFLESIIETADSPVDDRVVAHLLDRPLDDGGQWNMFINLVRKHGLVPKAVMPETQSSSNTMQMNGMLLAKLREGAKTLRDLRAGGRSAEELRTAKHEILEVVHRILCIHLGTPPTSFDWQWNDKDRKFGRDGAMTPQQFARKYIDIPIDDYVCLVNDTRATSPMNRTFTVAHLGNVVGGEPVKYLNIEVDTMKDIAMRLIQDGTPVWFGCDVGKMMARDVGMWDAAMFEYDKVYGTTFELDKAGRLDYHHSLMTHAMLFTGVDVVDGRPRRWRVENSWGDECGVKGYFTMTDSWFDEYMFEIAAPKDMLSAELQEALELEPIVLPPWDPMGALAR
jgi:bleomycin hydrolase